jgi:hypothetical protein
MWISHIQIVIVFLYGICDGSYRMYETSHNPNATTFDCLSNLITNKDDLISIKMDIRIVNIWFCRRSSTTINDAVSSVDHTTITNGEQWTFDRLREKNVSAEQLFDWYAPMDVIEEYLLGKEIGLFVNCSQKTTFWFGSRCQYTFDSFGDFENIIWDRFDGKDNFQNDILSITNGTCYSIPDGECQSVLCLDWREICDGKFLTEKLIKTDYFGYSQSKKRF